MTIRPNRSSKHTSGFSLIEVLIAVVILATGLLALSALQTSLAKNSAEAKTRSRVSALLSTRMDQLRSTPYDSIASSSDSCATASADDWVPATICNEAGLGSLSATQTVQVWSSTIGGGSFTQATPANPDFDPQFKRVVLSASWTDASNSAHSLSISSDMSALALRSSLIPPPDADGATSAGPVVRQADPATAGVIPIALGNGQSSAASNPTPELVGSKKNEVIVGTNFTVLNFTPDGSDAVIEKRFENQVVKCKCQYGAGGTDFANLPAVSRVAQWPAVWTGDRYDVYKPSPASAAPGQSLLAGPVSGVTQSDLCTECCRDHHNSGASGVAKFDPERTVATGESTGREKYDLDNQNTLQLVNNTNNGTYVNSCRMIRVDGLWRTASDMYSRQFGLLETASGARSGLPTTSATDAYKEFAKDYLEQYDGTTGTAPNNAQALFDDDVRGLNAPALVTIAAASNTDYRYLHARGLYVDYLEEQARARLVEVLADTGVGGRCPTGSDLANCVLPYLPFTTINLTEIAKWQASDPSVLTVNSGNLLETDSSEPSGSRTIGTAVGTSDNTGSALKSNSGVAVNASTDFVNFGGVDPIDHSAVSSDVQAFQVGGTVNAGPSFDVRVTGGGGNPFVFFTLGSDSNVECIKPIGGNHHCVTSTGTVLPQAGTVRVSHYWLETTQQRSVTAVCEGDSATATIEVPLFRNYVVTAASIGGSNGTPSASVNDNRVSEYTDISFDSIVANALVQITIAEQTGSPTYATVASCTTNGGGNQIKNIVWSKSWE